MIHRLGLKSPTVKRKGLARNVSQTVACGTMWFRMA